MSLREPNQKEERVLCLEVIGGKKRKINSLAQVRKKKYMVTYEIVGVVFYFF